MAKPTAATDGNAYVPYEDRTGNESIVYFTRDISPEGMKRSYEQVNARIAGKVGVKLHTGEPRGPNIIPAEWVREFLAGEPGLDGASIVETNTYYEGDRHTTEQHRKTPEINGWTFRSVDIMDHERAAELPVEGGKWQETMSVGSHLLNYDPLVVLTHCKGHPQGGLGGSNKNIGIGCADGRVGKKRIHTTEGSDDMWSIDMEGVDGAHQRVHEGNARPLRRADLLRERHAEHVGRL